MSCPHSGLLLSILTTKAPCFAAEVLKFVTTPTGLFLRGFGGRFRCFGESERNTGNRVLGDTQGGKTMVLNKARIYKMARFIGKLKPHKLDMELVAKPNESKKMDPFRCASAACVMGWMPAVFPKDVRWKIYDDDTWVKINVSKTKPRWADVDASIVGKFFGIPFQAANILFGTGEEGYRTPKEVSKGLMEYAKSNGKRLLGEDQ